RDPRVTEMLDLIEKGRYTDFVFVWAHSLGDVTWLMRRHYSEGHRIKENLQSWDRNATALLNEKLLVWFDKLYKE
ncbi:MAG: hypothetical protein IJY89_04650, partial [Clostridia bacterium]|nr:hypothetical protein [Clostridia bacterium]